MLFQNRSNFFKVLTYLWWLLLFQNFVLAIPCRADQKNKEPQPRVQSGDFFSTPVEKLISQMSLDDKIGQLLIVGFPQKTLDQDLRKHLMETRIGSFILFKRNIESLSAVTTLNTSLREFTFRTTTIPPLLSVDQEGGSVVRIDTKPRLPYFFQVGDSSNLNFARWFGNFSGRLLLEVGFNMNLAPVLDLSDSKSDSFINMRSFGSDGIRTGQMGLSYSTGLMEAGVVSTAKHFPGLGDSVLDPHNSTVSRSIGLGELSQKDLVPFKYYSRLGANTALMLSHLVYNAIDSSALPASLSPEIVENLLRNVVGFKGVVITDDLQMLSLPGSESKSAVAVRALSAGADMVMLSWSFADQRKTVASIKRAILEGKLPIQKVNEKLHRILSLKKWTYNTQSSQRRKPAQSIAGDLSPNLIRRENHFESSELLSAQEQLAKEKFASALMSPALLNKKKICMVAANDRLFQRLGRQPASLFSGFKFPPTATLNQLRGFFKTISCDLVFITLEKKDQIAKLNALNSFEGKAVVVVNFTIPNLLKNREKYSQVIDLYSLSAKHEISISSTLSTLIESISKRSRSVLHPNQRQSPTDF